MIQLSTHSMPYAAVPVDHSRAPPPVHSACLASAPANTLGQSFPTRFPSPYPQTFPSSLHLHNLAVVVSVFSADDDDSPTLLRPHSKRPGGCSILQSLLSASGRHSGISIDAYHRPSDKCRLAVGYLSVSTLFASSPGTPSTPDQSLVGRYLTAGIERITPPAWILHAPLPPLQLLKRKQTQRQTTRGKSFRPAQRL